MSREQERIRRKLEDNPIVECNKIQNKFCPELFSMFGRVKDPRHQSYVDLLPYKRNAWNYVL